MVAFQPRQRRSSTMRDAQSAAIVRPLLPHRPEFRSHEGSTSLQGKSTPSLGATTCRTDGQRHARQTRLAVVAWNRCKRPSHRQCGAFWL